jgi:hypothetical protein
MEVVVRSTIFILMMLSILLGCTSDYSDLPQVSVDFKWLTDQICFDKRSPEIILKNVPGSTKSLKVKMVDIDNRYNHGGGTVSYDGSDRIPVGALKNYEGPCPPMNMNPRYEIRVKAIDDNGNVIAFGKTYKIYPPVPE